VSYQYSVMPKRRRKIRYEKIAEEESDKNIPLTEFTVKKKIEVKLVEKKEEQHA